ncbi:MAG: protein kinase [Planctomycetes bacterium]|nr:protein kinase [Planctomycetota bacterium]
MNALAPPQIPQLRRGIRLGKYQLLSRLAEGGFSQVWKARDTLEDQNVALKIPNTYGPGAVDLEELRKEIRLSARLDHPNIVRIRNADKIGDLYVIASDLAVESLEDRLARRLSTWRAVSYIRQALQGLAYAHQNRIIHRDVKPSNFMIFPEDRLRIADFGIAMVANQTMVSATGSGTVLYYAPEQAHGYPCFASDLFSLGLICHEMITGRLPRWPFEWPFVGEDILRGKVPQEFIGMIRKATHLDYRLRYHDAGEMLAAFERIEPAIKRFLSPQLKPRRRRQRLGVWKELRFKEFQRAFGKKLFLRFECPECHGPISEHMSSCPWCGIDEIHFGEETEFDHFCSRCYRGLLKEWRYCPWCWGPGFPEADGTPRPNPRYRSSCGDCKQPLIEGMIYCPWCHSKREKPIDLEELPDRCSHCEGPVIDDFWDYCAWCAVPL